ncbi:MAG TPA: helix-hairpin-helix domain-containing protein [Vicinamibacterales bacterium]
MTRFVLLALVVASLVGASPFAQESPRSTGSGPAPMVNLNSATVPQLEVLPGIGRATAERIVEYRQKSGGFKKVEDLMNVRGIGEKSFLKLKPLITVAAPKTDRASQ